MQFLKLPILNTEGKKAIQKRQKKINLYKISVSILRDDSSYFLTNFFMISLDQTFIFKSLN